MAEASHKIHGPEVVECLLVEPKMKNERMPRVTSIMSEEEVKKTVEGVYFPAGSRIVLPSQQSSCFDCFSNGIVVYKDSIENGLRLPLHPFIAAFMRSMKLSIADMHPNCWRNFVGFLTFCRSVKVSPDAELFWSFFNSKYDKTYEKSNFWLRNYRGLVFSKLAYNIKDWRFRWFVVLLPPDTPLLFPRSSLPNPQSTVHKIRLTDELKELIERAQSLVRNNPKRLEWEYLGTPTNLRNAGVDNNEGFPDADAELPEYGFDKVTTIPPKSSNEKKDAKTVVGVKRQWVTVSSDSDEESDPDAPPESMMNVLFGGGEVEASPVLISPANQEGITEFMGSSSSERKTSLLTTSASTLPDQNQKGETGKMPPDEAVLQDFHQCLSRTTAWLSRKLAAQQEANNLRIELVQKQAMIDDMLRRKAEDEDTVQRLQADNLNLNKSLEAKEVELVELRSQFEEEKKLREKDRVLREMLGQEIRKAYELAESSLAQFQSKERAKAEEHEEAMQKVKMGIEAALKAMKKTKAKAKKRKEEINLLKEGEMRMQEIVSRLQKLNEQHAAKHHELAENIRILEARGALTKTLLNEEKRKLWATEVALQNARENHTTEEMKTKNKYFELASECARRSVSLFQEYQKGLGVQLAPGFVFGMEDLIVPPASSSGVDEPLVLPEQKEETTVPEA